MKITPVRVRYTNQILSFFCVKILCVLSTEKGDHPTFHNVKLHALQCNAVLRHACCGMHAAGCLEVDRCTQH